MAFQWTDFLLVAEALISEPIEGSSAESSFRTAVGRAYFAAFNVIKEHAMKHTGFEPDGRGDDHGKLLKHMRERPTFGRQKASALTRLRDWRSDSDYDRDCQVDKQRASGAVDEAKRLIGFYQTNQS